MATWRCGRIWLITALAMLAPSISTQGQSVVPKGSYVAVPPAVTTATGITPLGVQQLAQTLALAKQQQKTAAIEAAVMSVVTQIVTAVIQEVISAGGSASAADQAEIEDASAIAAIVSATVTIIQQVPTLLVLSEIVDCKMQNATAGLPLPNQLTRTQLSQIVASLPTGDARNARLVNDLKKLLSTVRPRS